MALLNPQQLHPAQIHEVMKTVGAANAKNLAANENIQDTLDRNGLGVDDVLDAVGSIMRGGETDSNRLKAAEIGLKLNGMLKNDEGVKIPIVNIIIRDSQSFEVNPILIPR